MIIFKIIGLINALYLFVLHSKSSGNCGFGDGCSSVLASIYSSVFGIPIAAFGISIFSILTILYVYKKLELISENTYISYSMITTLPATAVGTILIFIQWQFLNSFCPFCMLNSSILIILFVMIALKFKVENFDIKLSIPIAISLVLIAILPISNGYFIKNNNDKQNSVATQTIAARIAGEEISLYQVEKNIQNNVANYERKIHNLRKKEIYNFIYSLEAKKYGENLDVYLRKNVYKGIFVSDKQINDYFYDEKLDKNYEFDEIKDKIKKHLESKKELAAFYEKVKPLEKKYNVEYLIPTSRIVKVNKAHYNSHPKGSESAKIKIIEFADLECGACKRAYANIKDILKDYGENIYFEYRHFPLPFHKGAKLHAIGSLCAAKQGENAYWSYLDTAFANQERLSTITPESLIKEIDVDTQKFNQCMKRDETLQQVEKDIAEGERIGIQSTPTFVINGNIFIGVPNLEDILQFL